MALSTVDSLNKLFPDLYEKTLFVARHSTLMAPLVTPMSARGWMDRHVPIYNDATAYTVGETEDFVNYLELSKSTAATFTPSEIITGYLVTDRRRETDGDNVLNDAAYQMGAALAKKVDTDLLGDFADLGGTVGFAGSALTIARCALAMAILNDNTVTNPLAFVVSPAMWFRIWRELGQPDANQAFLGDKANQALKDYYRGQPLGVPWYISGNIENAAVSDATRGTATAESGSAAFGGLFHKSALVLDTRRKPTPETLRDGSKRAWEVTLHMGYAHGVLRPTFGVALLADNNMPVTL